MSGGDFMSHMLALGITDEWSDHLETAREAMNQLTADADTSVGYTKQRLKEEWNELEIYFARVEKTTKYWRDWSDKEVQKQLLIISARLKMVVVRAYSMLSQVATMAGMTIDPVFNAIIHLAFTTWEQYLVLASAHSTSMNVIGAGLAILSATLSMTAAVQAQQEQQRVKVELEAQRAEMDRARGLGFSVTFMSD